MKKIGFIILSLILMQSCGSNSNELKIKEIYLEIDNLQNDSELLVHKSDSLLTEMKLLSVELDFLALTKNKEKIHTAVEKIKSLNAEIEENSEKHDQNNIKIKDLQAEIDRLIKNN